MKKKISIGPGVSIDLDKLMTGRLLLQATSGAGKSWLLRRLLEQSHGLCQQIVIDPEGEFSTLREKLDYVLAAKQGGDTLADVRTAKLLAERLLELGVSAIIDIYELNPTQRVQFVRYFLEAMVDAPKNLWHPVLVVLDEAHAYCPEKGSGEAESSDAVKALCTRGRKRGFCAVLATQRLPSLSKDAAAMCANKLIGRASLDSDIKRSGAELGMDAKAAIAAIRDLNDGEFYAFGPAISKAVSKVKVGPVETTHPEAGSQLAARIPPPTDKVKALLPKLSDLPAEAADRERTVAEMKKAIVDKDRRIKELERDSAKQSAAIREFIPANRVEKPALTDADRALIEKLAGQIAETQRVLAANIAFDVEDVTRRLTGLIAQFKSDVALEHNDARADFIALLEKASVQKLLEKLNGLAVVPAPVVPGSRIPAATAPRTPSTTPSRVPTAHPTPQPASDGDSDLGKGAPSRMLAVLKQFPGIDARRLGALSGVSPKLSTYRVAIAKLKQAGYIVGERTGYRLTPDGEAAAAHVQDAPTGPEAIDHWRRELGDGAPRKIFDALIEAYPTQLDASGVFDRTGIDPSLSTYRVAIAKLRNLALIDGGRAGMSASPALFLEGR